jgi:serine/threonine-protein kinase RsbW
MTLAEDRILIHVRDEGQGFDVDAVPSPLDEQNILKDGGRGIFFMRKFMDLVEFHHSNGEGMEVIMTKYLSR